MDIGTAKAEATMRTGYRAHTSTQPLTWQRDMSTGNRLMAVQYVKYIHRNNLLLPEGTFNVEISNIKFHRHGGIRP